MQPSEERGSDASGISFSAYHNASQLRADGWNRLKHNAARLAESAGRQGKIASLRAAGEDDLRLLEPVESYWAFPSKDSMARLRQLFGQGNFPGLAQATARLNRSLASESYRSRVGRGEASLLDDEEEEDEPEKATPVEDLARTRPYFEVLIVDGISARYVDLAEASRQMASGRALVSANFVTPDPPGFPILVPGQVVSEALVAFMTALDVKEIHGYRPELGLRLFTEQALAAASATLP